MKSIGSSLAAAAVLGLAGGACLAAGLLDRRMAHAEQHVSTRDYEEPAESFARMERYVEFASLVPGIGRGPLNDIRARRADVDYRQGRYGRIVSEQTDPVGAVPADNVALQFVVAQSVFRAGQAQATNRDRALEVLDAAIGGYLTVLKNTTQHRAAAYNYEYLIRLRDDVEKGRRKADLSTLTPDGVFGRSGAAVDTSGSDQFKVLVPLTPGERDKAGAGKALPFKRKG